MNSNLRLVILGEGPDHGRLRNKIYSLDNSMLKEGLQWDKLIILSGKVGQNKIFEYMKAADIFILNSGYEGLPHLILEAMLMRLPIAASCMCGNIEVVEDGKSGLLFEYNNKEQIKEVILKLFKDKELKNVLINGSIEKMKEFSHESMIKETKKILEISAI